MSDVTMLYFSFSFTQSSTSEIYTLSLHDALPIFRDELGHEARLREYYLTWSADAFEIRIGRQQQDRKSTRLNSSHVKISYAVFCLKKKNSTQQKRFKTTL